MLRKTCQETALLLLVLFANCCINAFVFPNNVKVISPALLQAKHLEHVRRLQATPENEETATTTVNALPPSTTTEDISVASISSSSSTASVAMMISQENKRILIEELGYKRSDVEQLKYDLAPVLVEKRFRCPPEGIPDSWCRPLEDQQMMQRLENESKYPLKLPFLGIALILFGKGFSDALITIIKVNIDFPGASLVDEFYGIPILLIDAICVTVGAFLGWWTWNTMK